EAPPADGSRRMTQRLQLDALWDRPTYRMRRFNFTAAPGEHACFAGFKSMMQHTDRCRGWQRVYPTKGTKQLFFNTGANKESNFTLQDVVAEHINVWVEENSTELHRDVALKAAEIYSNALGTEELKPTPDTQSWMEQECKVMGQMPFMYSCSNRINVLVQSCGFDNAFVMSSDYLVNYPAPVNNKSNNNNDIIFYLCQELVDGNPNPYAVANTFAHELAHVIQGGCLVLNQGRNVLEPDVEAEPVTDAEVESLECVDVGVDFEQAWALSGLDAKRPRVTSKDVRDALQAHQLQVRCTNTQLHNFVVRFNRTGPPQSGKGNLTLSQVRNAAMDYMCESMEAWATWNPWRLVVLPCPTFEVDRICVVWTCPGMLRRAACLQGKVVKLAVDAKQKIVANEYGIVTVSFLVSSATPSKTWAGTKHTKSIDTHTATQEPFIQALVNSESEANNMTQIFTEACNLAERYCGLDLRAQVWQVHKDYAKGIEASRRKVFPYARPCDDYVHMRRASYKILQKYLLTKTQRPRTSKDKAKKRASPSPARASTMAAKEEEDFSQLERVIQISREVPTVQMFDAIWQLAFPWLREKSAAAAEYLQRTYFQQVPTESLQKGFRCNATLWGADSLWFGGFWGGILGTYPGSSSGTQPLESFHSYWQGTIKAKARTSPADRFGSMQDLFQKDWAARFAWDEEKKFVTWPARSADALFNSQSLRSAGRSPARDFWEHREKRLCGNRNYREVYIRTGDTEGAGMEGMTTFWVLQSRAHDKVTAAEAIVLPDVAETVANLIAAEGTQLEKWLAKGGIVREGRLELGALQKYMHRYCAVLEGHLVQVSWPRSHRKLKKAVPGKLCTCREFLLHADCEHVLFIKALQNDPTASMQNIPTLRPRGFGSSSGVMMEGGATWLEGNLLNLAPRPMIYAWGFRDWNRINAAHIYAQSKKTNARKFYQIHAMLLTYLSQEALLGDRGSSALQNYETFSEDLAPFGRRTYDYFLQFVGKDQPGAFDPLELEVNSVEHPFGEVLLNFRVALAAQCINEASKRPTEPRYWMPENLRDRPFWDCTSFPTFGPTEGAAQHEGLELHYGGAGIYRLALAADATVQVDPSADWQLRTKVLAAGHAGGPAEVRELRPGETASFQGEREIFVVQVNVDPEGETLSRADKGSVWNQDICEKLQPGCVGKAWTTSKNGFYPSLAAEGLRTPMLKLPEAKNLTLSFQAWWQLEGVDGGFFSKTENGCEIDGWDGVQVRLHVYSDPTADAHSHGEQVVVLEPHGGYDNRSHHVIAALGNVGIRAPYTKSYAKDCKSLDGWTGSSPHDGFAVQNFSLEKFAGEYARVEVVFASDSGTVMSGFWLKDLEVKSNGQVVFNQTESLYGSTFVYSIPAGTMGSAGVPVVVQYPDGFEADVGLKKASVTRRGAWSATWSKGQLRRAYVGWSYESPILETKTMKLQPNQEACLQLRAPFRGKPSVATLFTLVDKIGIRSVTLTGRDTQRMASLGTAVTSPSLGVTDPGVHRFHLSGWPTLEAGELFFLCVSTGDVESLMTDPSSSSPFLHLPLTNVAAVTQDEPGWMLLRQDGKEVPADELSNLWLEHRITLRAEFVEETKQFDTVCSACAPFPRLT
ncbi:unnamed protein product, partial [Durusdinium trenchii]